MQMQTMLSRRRLLAAGGALAFARGVASAQTPEPALPPDSQTPEMAQRPVSLSVAVGALPPSWDPAGATSLETQWLDSLLYDAIARWNANGDVFPALGLGWSITALDRVIEINLRPDAFFHDGERLTAQDVRFSLERIRSGDEGVSDAWRLEHVREIEAGNDQTVRIVLDQPDASLVASLAAPVLSVLREGVPADRIRGGTGPFSVGYQSPDVVVFRRNPLFWQVGRPRFESLHIRPIADDTERSTALATGMVDLMPNVPLLDIPMLRAEPSVQLVGGASNHLCLLHVNLNEPHLRDPRLRQLLSAAIDRTRLVEVATAGQAEASGLLFPARSWARVDEPEPEGLTTEAARAGLADLGITADLRLRLLTDNADATLANTAVVLQEQLAYAGIALSVELLDGDELANAVERRDYDLLATYTRPWRDPHELVRPLLASDGVGNYTGYADSGVDGLIRGATITSDRQVRQARYARLQQRILEDMPVIMLFRPHYYDAMTTRISGYAELQPVTARGLLPARLAPVDGE